MNPLLILLLNVYAIAKGINAIVGLLTVLVAIEVLRFAWSVRQHYFFRRIYLGFFRLWKYDGESTSHWGW